jgi:hypothetical protein
MAAAVPRGVQVAGGSAMKGSAEIISEENGRGIVNPMIFAVFRFTISSKPRRLVHRVVNGVYWLDQEALAVAAKT